MLLLNNLSTKEQIYLTELYNTGADYKISFDMLSCLKRGVLEQCLQIFESRGPDKRKVKVVKKILEKIKYPGEIKECKVSEKKVKLLQDEDKNNEN